MLKTATKNISKEQHIATVQEKILLEKQLPPNANKSGPTVELFFHELTNEKSIAQKMLAGTGIFFISILFLITLPFIALGIKLFSRESVFERVAVTGKRGRVFHQFLYPTKSDDPHKDFGFGNFLKRTKLYKIPSIINYFRGEMDLVGPTPYKTLWCNDWNREFSDFYKRFALKPGILGMSPGISDPDDDEQIERSLKMDLQYVLHPTLNKDMARLWSQQNYMSRR